MRISEGLLQELEQEAQTTRRVLERVPQEHLEWRPHPKAMTLNELATHVANIPGGVATGAAQPTMQLPDFPRPTVTEARDLLRLLDESVTKARTILGPMGDEEMQATWRLMNGDQTVMAMPRMAFLRAIMLNHWYHHRGQLSTYLRHLGVALPSIYGPSADENPFVTQATVSATA
jgi:uncharacterized damage-inducible protein DinB